MSPGWVVQLVRAPSQYAKVVGPISSQSTYKEHLMGPARCGWAGRAAFCKVKGCQFDSWSGCMPGLPVQS